MKRGLVLGILLLAGSLSVAVMGFQGPPAGQGQGGPPAGAPVHLAQRRADAVVLRRL